MKKGIVVLLSLFVGLLGKAQTGVFNHVVDWNAYSEIIKTIPWGNNGWIMGGYTGSCGDALIMRLDGNGDTLWISEGWDYELNAVTDIDSFNGKIYVTGRSYEIPVKKQTTAERQSTDDFGNLYVMILDSNGNKLMNQPYIFWLNTGYDSAYLNHEVNYDAGEPWGRPFFKYQIAAYDDSVFYVSRGNILGKYKINHQQTYPLYYPNMLWTKTYPGYINDIVAGNGYLYLATDSGLVQTDTSGAVLRQLPSAGWVLNGYKTADERLFFLDTAKVFETDTLLNVLNSYDLVDSLTNPYAIAGKNGHVMVMGRKPDSTYAMAVLDTALQWGYSFPLTSQCFRPASCSVNDSGILVATNHIEPQTYYLPSGVFNANYTGYDLQGNTTPASNASLQILSTAKVDSFFIQPSCNNGFITFYYLEFKILNTGLDTIKSMSVFTDQIQLNFCDPAPSCDFDDIFFNAIGLNLAPGDTTTVGRMRVKIVDGTPTYLPIYVMAINGNPIADSCNYPSTQIGPYVSYVGIGEPKASNTHVYPNPVDAALHIDFGTIDHPVTCQIFDLAGRLCIAQTLANSNNTVDTQALNAGMYLYRLVASDGSATVGKFCKE